MEGTVARGLAVAAVMALVVVGLSAQGRGGQGAQGGGGGQGGRGGRGGGAAERAAAEAAAAKDPRNFTGYWGMPGYKMPSGHGFEAREACAALKDPSGAPMERCDQPWEAKGGAKFGLKDFLNKRGLAWMNFRDEMISEKHLCLPTALPGIMDHEAGAVRMDGPNVMKIQYSTDAFAEGVERTIWMDGRKHPEPREIYMQGHSVGHFEGNELVIETTNFPFNPDGLDDHIHVPSSAAKKLTERWKKTSPTTLDVTFTQEDQVFLKKPWTWTWHYVKGTQAPLTDYTCDPEAAWLQIQVATPSPYNEN
jgi:hypothetical protein